MDGRAEQVAVPYGARSVLLLAVRGVLPLSSAGCGGSVVKATVCGAARSEYSHHKIEISVRPQPVPKFLPKAPH